MGVSIIICKKCGRKRKLAGRGMCKTCSNQEYRAKKKVCIICGELKPQEAGGMCPNCYIKQHKNPTVVCKKCGKTKEHFGHGFCANCYQAQYTSPIKICKVCGKEKPHAAKGMCQTCYEIKNGYAAKKRHCRRARLNNAEGSFTTKEWKDLCKKFSHCPMCGRKFSFRLKRTVDHIIPLSKGGSNSIDNIQPLCGSCNSSKGAKIA